MPLCHSEASSPYQDAPDWQNEPWKQCNEVVCGFPLLIFTVVFFLMVSSGWLWMYFIFFVIANFIVFKMHCIIIVESGSLQTFCRLMPAWFKNHKCTCKNEKAEVLLEEYNILHNVNHGRLWN